jgi:hypothetical protein
METQQKLVVPFVALWSSEKEDVGKVGLEGDGNIDGPRDQRGIFWQPYGDTMGVGRPLFAEVHPIRQKMCMEGPYCQVCGTKMPNKNVPWIVPPATNSEWDRDLSSPDSRPFITHTPPTCRDCWPVAMTLCPHLKAHHFFKLIVKDYSIAGVFGDHFWRAHPFAPIQGEQGLVLRFGNSQHAEARKGFVAKQLVVAINRWKVVA